MRHLDLFSGIGGFALAARWMNWQTVGFCEIEDFPRKILAKNFPGIPIFDDVRTIDADRLAGLGRIDIVTGGFPCQDVSTAGKRAGLAGARSGLWAEMFRVICAAQPAWVVAENVPGLRTIGADRVLADLAEAGYTAWPLVVGAVHAGAPHRRQRVWIVGHADCHDGAAQRAFRQGMDTKSARVRDGIAANAIGSDLRDESRRNGRELADRLEPRCAGAPKPGHDGAQGTAADAASIRCDRSAAFTGGTGESETAGRLQEPARGGADAANAAEHRRREGRAESARIEGRHGAADGGAGVYQPDWRSWTDAPEPAVRAVDDGLPVWVAGCRVPALKALGNAIVPQVAYYLFRAIEDAVDGHH